jgi:hypothetical protein
MQDQSKPERLRIQATYCHDRWCTPCARTKARIVAGNLRSLIADVPHRFITLTLKATDESLATRIDHLYKSFARLRRSKCWKSAITAGTAFCEPVWSPRSNAWHCHLHIIAQGKYIPQAALSAAWLLATGDSYIVDIRLIRGHDQAVDYVCKYACKPLSPDVIRLTDRLQEAMIALRGRRLILPFAGWGKVKLTHNSPETEWKAIVSLRDLLQRAAGGDAWSNHLLTILRGVQSCNQLDLFPAPP